MKKKFTISLLILSLSFSLIAQNTDLTWFWSANNCAEYGIITTDGTADDTASTHTFTVTSFDVFKSTLFPDASEWAFTIGQPNVGFEWDGTQITTYWRLNGTYTNGFSFYYSDTMDLAYGFDIDYLSIKDPGYAFNYEYFDLIIVADTNAGCNMTNIDPKISDNIIIYPNPTSDFIEISNIENNNVKIFSISGNLIKQIENNSNNLKIDFRDQKNGVYLIQIYNDKEIIANKVVIKQ